ncbi:MAG: AMP-binding protein, partial [Planctomycetota bacterium]
SLMREVRPTVMTMVPRLVEKIYDRVAQGIDAAWVGRRALGRWALQQATDRDPDAPKPVGMRLSDGLVYQKVRAALGGKMRYLIVGGAALEPRFERFLRNIGVPVYTGYGLTEAGPVVSVNAPTARQTATVGKPFPGVELRFGANAEILVRGPGVMRGYHRDATVTAETIDIDGWLHTGDCGRLNPDGYLIITGRIKELCKTANGKYVSPIPIEQLLSRSQMVDQACVIADGRPYASALFFLTEELAKAHVRNGKPDAELTSELQRVVEEANAGLDHWQQVRRWAIVPAPAVIGRELTPTLKLRRLAVAQQYREIIDTLYREGNSP